MSSNPGAAATEVVSEPAENGKADSTVEVSVGEKAKAAKVGSRVPLGQCMKPGLVFPETLRFLGLISFSHSRLWGPGK